MTKFGRTYITNLHFNKNLLDLHQKRSWGETKIGVKMLKRLRSGLIFLTLAETMKKLIFIKVKNCYPEEEAAHKILARNFESSRKALIIFYLFRVKLMDILPVILVK